MRGRTVLSIATAAVAATIFAAPAPAVDRPDGTGTGAEATSYLHTVEPTALRPGDSLVLAGVVENTGDEPLANVQALPRWSNVQLENREEAQRVGTDPSLRWGFRRDDPYQVIADLLEPGEQGRFELTIDAADLAFGNAGVYTAGVDIRGTLSNGERITLDTSRTVVPWIPGEPPSAVQVAMVWPVAAPSSLLPDGSLNDDSLASQLAADGPLNAIVDAAGPEPVSWLVDPDLLDTVDALADGDEDASLARSWLSTFDAATTDDVFLLPYAQPDVEAMLAAGPDLASQVTSASVDVTRQSVRTRGPARTGVAQPEGGAASEPALSLLAESGVRTVVLSGAAVTPPAGQPFVELETAGGGLEAILTDPGLDAAVAAAYSATNTPAGLLDLKQRWAAETVMVALDAELRGASPAPLVVTPPKRWTPSPEVASAVMDAWTSLPWVTPLPVTELEPTEQTTSVRPIPTDTTNLLPAENVDAVADLQAAVQDYTDLLDETGPAFRRELELVVLRAASSSWRDDPAAGVEYASSITRELTGQLRDVQVTVPETVTLSSRAGIFPLTVTNELDRPVTVKLAIQSTNPDRLHVDEVPVQHVAAGGRETIEVQAEAVTNGRVPISVQLTTTNGSALGTATETVVHATDYGTVGWVIIAGAGALFGTVLVRAMLRRRSGRASDTSDTADTWDGTAEEPPPGQETPDVDVNGSPPAKTEVTR